MNARRKAALLTAAAGALVIVGAGSASAHSHHGFGHLFGGEGVEQENTCATAPGALGTVEAPITGVLPPIEYNTDCFNLDATGGHASEQSNSCTTAPSAIALTGILAPASEIEYNTECANIAV